VQKTLGSRQPLVSGDNNQMLVIDAATRDELVRLRQEALDAMPLKMGASNDASSDSRNSTGGGGRGREGGSG
jgi:hypothetical protein